MRTLPGTRALKMLVSAGRHLNFTRAADEIGLTPAAVSYQIKEIEDQLGVKLFVRTNRSIHLTPEGKVLCEAAVDALDIVTRATARVQKMSRRSTTQLKVTVDPQFATKWLMRRVEQFRKVHQDIELRFDVSYDVKDFELDDVDVGIRYGSGKYPGLTTHRLFGNVIVPVCSPRLLASGKPLKEPRDLMHHTLAHIEWSRDGLTWPNWHMWMAAAGVHDFDDSRAIVFASSNDAVEAALAGEAVALADFAMVASELSEGRLIRPFELSVKAPSEFAYFLVYPKEAAAEPRISAFREWLLEQVAEPVE
ncbi:transcriptional regulator GcvA [Rhizobium sp. TH2]|uniref:transcriptional regulator GcvA n=1 Tax=Rhizobium sp. TH2 TaxID=2775403 RepID=UPI0021580A89|nr:transcriptional regulator GcvA [Rhizobium sp. TH2]UVC10130.1 transcriptional regulator GcvA [Rhizobium sp. TH2]